MGYNTSSTPGILQSKPSHTASLPSHRPRRSQTISSISKTHGPKAHQALDKAGISLRQQVGLLYTN